jgi:hypothetical protein
MLKNRVHAILADRGIRVPERLWTTAGRAWLADLDLPVVQRLIVDDCLGLIDQLTRSLPGWSGTCWPGPSPTQDPGASGPARYRQAHRHDPGRRDRRHRSLRHDPQAVRRAGLTPAVRNLRPRSVTATAPSRAPLGSASSWRRRPTRPRPARCSLAAMPSALPAAAGTSPPPRLPASRSRARSRSSRRWRPLLSRRRRSPSRVRSGYMLCRQHGRSADRAARPGCQRHADPPRSGGPNGCVQDQLR